MIEPPPQPVSDTFNYSQWTDTTNTNATTAYVKRNFLSKVLSDVAQGLISFAAGIASNTITLYSGTTLTLGQNDNTKSVSIWYPTLANSKPISSVNNSTLASTEWVNSWFSYVKGLEQSWTQLNSYSAGIEVSNIDAYAINDAVNFISDAGARNNVNILNGNYTGTQNKGNLSIMGGTCDAGTTNGSIQIQHGDTMASMRIGNGNSSLDLRAGTINLYYPLTPNYSYTSLGTGTGKIGEIRAGTYTGAGTMQSGTSKTYSILSLTSTGVYHIQAQGTIYAVNTSNVSVFRAWIDSDVPNAPYGSRCGQYSSFNLGGFIETTNLDFSISSIIYNVGTSPVGTNTYRIYVSTTFTGAATVVTDYNFKFLITRIA